MKAYPEMICSRRRAYVYLILLCLALTILDVVAVEIYFRPLQVWDRIWIWHGVYSAIALGAALLLVYQLRSLIPLVVIFFFLYGLEDTLFYALQGYLPSKYWGVSILGIWEPSLNLVLSINLLGLATIMLFALAGEL